MDAIGHRKHLRHGTQGTLLHGGMRACAWLPPPVAPLSLILPLPVGFESRH